MFVKMFMENDWRAHTVLAFFKSGCNQSNLSTQGCKHNDNIYLIKGNIFYFF